MQYAIKQYFWKSLIVTFIIAVILMFSLQVDSRDVLYNVASSCDIIIYNIGSDDLDQVEEAVYIASSMLTNDVWLCTHNQNC